MISNDAGNTAESDPSRIEKVRQLQSQGEASVKDLISMLSEPSWVVRRAVVEALGDLGEPAVALLCRELKNERSSEARIAATVDALVASRGDADVAVAALADDPDPAVAADVAQILGRRRKPVSTPVLIRLTKHINDNVAVGAMEALGRIGGRAAIEALIGSIESGNFFRTFPAIDVLGRSGDPRVVEPLVKLLHNPNYLPEASRALGRSGERSAVKPLIHLLHSHSDAAVRIAAVSLSELRDRFEEKSGKEVSSIEDQFRSQIPADIVRRVSRMLPDADTLEAVSICKFLGIVGNAEAAAQLTERLDGPAAVAESAAEALKKIGQTADAHLRNALRKGESGSRKVLLPVVTRAAAAEDVAACLADADSEVRVIACETLARIAATSEVPALFKLLSDSNLRVVHSAVAAIQSLGSRETRTLAVEAASSPLPGVRRSALTILAYFGDSSATQPMLKGLEDPDTRVREAAIQGLPYLEDLRAQEALFEFARNANARTRGLVLRAIGQLPKASERAFSVLLKGIKDSDAWVRYYACQSLGRLGFASAASEISALLSDEAGQVRVSAVEALSHLNSPEAHSALRAAVESADPDVKRAAIVGLGITRRMEDFPVVLNAVTSADGPMRLLALSAIVNFPSPKVFEVLSAAGHDANEQIRGAAIGFLAARPEQEATVALTELLSDERTQGKARNALSVSSAGRLAGILIALETASDELAPLLISILTRMDFALAANALISAMKLSNVAARKAAAAGIAVHITKPHMLQALSDAAENDPDREVRQVAKLHLNE